MQRRASFFGFFFSWERQKNRNKSIKHCFSHCFLFPTIQLHYVLGAHILSFTSPHPLPPPWRSQLPHFSFDCLSNHQLPPQFFSPVRLSTISSHQRVCQPYLFLCRPFSQSPPPVPEANPAGSPSLRSFHLPRTNNLPFLV